jgi:hypothetical protein
LSGNNQNAGMGNSAGIFYHYQADAKLPWIEHPPGFWGWHFSIATTGWLKRRIIIYSVITDVQFNLIVRQFYSVNQDPFYVQCDFTLLAIPSGFRHYLSMLMGR